MIRFQRAGLLVCLLAFTASAQEKHNRKPETATAVLNLTVLRVANGKPVKNAEIVLHPVDEHGRQKQEGLELKSHEDGKASVNGIAYGKLRIQVIAPGFRTYGADYDVNQPNLEITIKLEKPTEQFSIYK